MDPAKSIDFRKSRIWDRVNLSMETLVIEKEPQKSGPPTVLARAFSGGERNRLFMQRNGNFEDCSLVSGMDFKQDGRGFAVADLDKNGWLDLAITSPNSPRLRLLKNNIDSVLDSAKGNRSTFVKLVGASESAAPQLGLSSKDPVGAKMIVECGEVERAYQYNCGEGLSSQNSRWIHIGMQNHEQIDRLKVIWPSGKTTTHGPIKAGDRVVLTESR